MVNRIENCQQLPWGALPQYPPVKAVPKVHAYLIPWYTSGFE